jgi:hypothetical protein
LLSLITRTISNSPNPNSPMVRADSLGIVILCCRRRRHGMRIISLEEKALVVCLLTSSRIFAKSQEAQAPD